MYANKNQQRLNYWFDNYGGSMYRGEVIGHPETAVPSRRLPRKHTKNCQICSGGRCIFKHEEEKE